MSHDPTAPHGAEPSLDHAPDAPGPAETATGDTHVARTDGPAPDAGIDGALVEASDLSVPTEPVLTASDEPGPSRTRRTGAVATYLLAILGGVVVTLAILVAAGAVRIETQPTFTAAGASVGVSTAPVTVEIWADYQCPYCGLFAHGLEPTILRDYAATGAAILTFRDYAFLGQESLDAAVAARCADRQGRFWAYHDLLYASQNGENQGTFAQANLVKLAAFAGLDTTAFTNCLGDGTVATEVAAETKQGKTLGIESTPTVRIVWPGGSKILKGLVPLKTLTDAIDAAVSRKAETSGGSGASGGASGNPSAGPSDGPESTDTSPAPSPSGG